MIRDLLGVFGFVLVVQMGITDALLAVNPMAYAFAVIIFAFTVIDFNVKSNYKANSPMIFIPVAAFLISIIFSSGYALSYVHISPLLGNGFSQAAGLSLLFGELGTLISIVYLVEIPYSRRLLEAGYDGGEVNSALDGFSSGIVGLGGISLLITILLLFLAGAVPFLNIGVLPALLLFGLFYIIIFRFVISEKERGKKDPNRK